MSFDSVFHGAPSSAGGQSVSSGRTSLGIDVVAGQVYYRNPETGAWTPIAGGGGGGAVTSVNGQTGVVELTILPNNPSSISTKTAPYTAVQTDGTILCNGNVASTITNVVETSGSVVTLTAANTLVAGQTVYLSGLTTATWLNGLVVTASATGLSTSQFEFTDPTAHGTQATHSETGTATLLVVVTLPNNLTTGTTLRIKNIGTTLVTISSSVNIDGAATYSLNPYPYASIDVQFDGNTWWIL